jgi:hypothetical protein
MSSYHDITKEMRSILTANIQSLINTIKKTTSYWIEKKNIYSTYSPLSSTQTYDFVVLTFLNHPRKIILIVPQIRKAKDLSVALRTHNKEDYCLLLYGAV